MFINGARYFSKKSLNKERGKEKKEKKRKRERERKRKEKERQREKGVPAVCDDRCKVFQESNSVIALPPSVCFTRGKGNGQNVTKNRLQICKRVKMEGNYRMQGGLVSSGA